MEGPLVRLMEMTRREFVPPSTFRIGTPDDFIGPEENADSYGVIMLDERWKAAHRFFVVLSQPSSLPLSE